MALKQAASLAVISLLQIKNNNRRVVHYRIVHAKLGGIAFWISEEEKRREKEKRKKEKRREEGEKEKRREREKNKIMWNFKNIGNIEI